MQRKKGEVTRSITNVVMREKKTIIYAHLIFRAVVISYTFYLHLYTLNLRWILLCVPELS